MNVSTKKTNSEIILEAIQDLHASEQIVTRETLAEVTNLKLTVIDDRVAILVDEGKVLRVQRGVFVPAPMHRPARLITKTLMPDGSVSIEVGDDHVLMLTPRENRMLGDLMSGAAQAYTQIAEGHHTAALAAELAVKVRKLEAKVKALTNNSSAESQLPLSLP